MSHAFKAEVRFFLVAEAVWLCPKPAAIPADAVMPIPPRARGTGGKAATENGKRVDVHQGLVFAVLGMKVWRVVIVVEDLDHDAVEPTDLRHPKGRGGVL